MRNRFLRSVRRLLWNVVASLISVIVLLIILELATRLTGLVDKAPDLAVRIHPADGVRLYDPAYGYRLRPHAKAFDGTRHIDSHGFLTEVGRETEQTKPQDTVRIVCMGDSRTWGAAQTARGVLPYQNPYPEVLEELLRARPPVAGRQFEVINAGVFGYTSQQGLRSWELELSKYDPDVVTIFYGFNDFGREPIKDLNWFDRWMADDSDDPPARWVQYRILESHLYRTALHLGIAIRDRRASQQGAPPASPPQVFAPLGLRRRVEPWRYQDNLIRMIRSVRSRGAEVIFIVTPVGPLPADPRQVANTWALYFLTSYDKLVREHQRYATILHGVASAYGVPVIDLTERFRATPEVFSDWDIVHPLRQGQRMIAEELYETLRRGLTTTKNPANRCKGEACDDSAFSY